MDEKLQTICFLQEIRFLCKQYREVEGTIIENISFVNINQRKTGMSILISCKVNVSAEQTTRGRDLT